MLPPADIDDELEAALRGERPGKRVKQLMHFEQLKMTDTTKALIGIVVFLALSMLGWMAAKIDSTDSTLDEIRAGQIQQAKDSAAEAKDQAARDIALLTRLSGVESEVQGLKSRTEKLEQEIRK